MLKFKRLACVIEDVTQYILIFTFQPECKINMHASCLKKKVIEAGIMACFLECAESPYLWKGAGIG